MSRDKANYLTWGEMSKAWWGWARESSVGRAEPQRKAAQFLRLVGYHRQGWKRFMNCFRSSEITVFGWLCIGSVRKDELRMYPCCRIRLRRLTRHTSDELLNRSLSRRRRKKGSSKGALATFGKLFNSLTGVELASFASHGTSGTCLIVRMIYTL
jgi:hypothetical protein